MDRELLPGPPFPLFMNTWFMECPIHLFILKELPMSKFQIDYLVSCFDANNYKKFLTRNNCPTLKEGVSLFLGRTSDPYTLELLATFIEFTIRLDDIRPNCVRQNDIWPK